MVNQWIAINSIDQLNQLQNWTGLSPIDRQTYLLHGPDHHIVLLYDTQIVAYCSLWWNNVPDYPEQKLGCIGHYAAQNELAAHQLLQQVCQRLTVQGCTLAVAPIDGNTWRSYRFITDRGTEPSFFLEPDHADTYPSHFLSCGFSPLAGYSSALNSDLAQLDPRIDLVAKRMSDLGVKIRSIDLENFEIELARIHTLCLISFRHNFLYSPIAQSEFIAQYSQIKSYLHPELVLIAEQAEQLVGFLFAIPDFLQVQRNRSTNGAPDLGASDLGASDLGVSDRGASDRGASGRASINTIVIKTVAVLPGRTYAGLGNLLVSEAQSIAHRLGYRRAIHALMHDANNSRNLSGRYATPIRRYTLFCKPLAK